MPLPETAAPAQLAPASCHLPTLLLVGDPTGLNVAREALVELELGWEVVFAGSGYDAHEVPAVRDVDVIVIDLGYRQVDGVDLVASLHARFPQTPIVLMSAPYAVSVALEGVRKGAVNHFPRDLLDTEPAAVLGTLQATAREHRKRRTALSRMDHLHLQFTLGADRGEVPAVAGRLAAATLETGLCDRPAAMRVGVALEECLLNAIIHGSLEVSSDLRQGDEAIYYRTIEERRTRAPYAGRKVKVTARVGKAEGVFVVEDEGPGFNTAGLPNPTDPANLLRVGGRGILLMRSFMTAVHFADRGNRVTLVKRRA